MYFCNRKDIHDGVHIANEVVQYCYIGSSQEKKKVVKLDLEEAYDRINWDSLSLLWLKRDVAQMELHVF